MDACVALKNRLLDQVHYGRESGDVDELHRVLDTLEAVKGMWEAAHYSYKGTEIAHAVVNAADTLKEKTHNWKRLRRLDTLIARANRVADDFYRRQQAYLFPELAVA